MSQYVVDLEPTNDTSADHEIGDRNLLKVRIQLPHHQPISGSDCIVELSLSKQAMLGLGKALIRMAHSDAPSIGREINPCTSELPTETLGFYLHPQSCKLNIWGYDLGTVEEALKGTPNQAL